MKKKNVARVNLAKLGLAVFLACGAASLPAFGMQVEADESNYTTVTGTVKKGTTASMLLLSTVQGDMEIKIDSSTDTSGCKLLLTDRKISAKVYRGSDAYMHAASISSQVEKPSVSVDSSSGTTVSATIKEKSTEELLYVSTPQGDMEIKIDPTTDTSGLSVMISGKTYSIVCARGSDAYMHAVSISDLAAYTPAASSANGGVSMSGVYVTGTVSKNTTSSILYLNTNGGEMQFKLDSTTDTLQGMVHVPGNSLSVAYTHGSDGYLHATRVAGVKTASGATVNSSTSTVTGTVDSRSTENVLYLSTSGGTMELKLDTVTSLTNCKALTVGKWVTVTCAYGSDAYMHAISITG